MSQLLKFCRGSLCLVKVLFSISKFEAVWVATSCGLEWGWEAERSSSLSGNCLSGCRAWSDSDYYWNVMTQSYRTSHKILSLRLYVGAQISPHHFLGLFSSLFLTSLPYSPHRGCLLSHCPRLPSGSPCHRLRFLQIFVCTLYLWLAHKDKIAEILLRRGEVGMVMKTNILAYPVILLPCATMLLIGYALSFRI